MKTGVAAVGHLLAVCVCLACGQVTVDRGTQDRFFDSNGVRIRYRVWGQGQPVVLIHGFGESLENWDQRGVVRTLSAHFQVIAMDVRGHGRSDKPHDPKSYGAELSGDVVRLLRHLGVTKAHVVGYSMGALVALDCAALHQEHALSVVLGGQGGTRQKPSTSSGSRQRRSSEGRSPGGMVTTHRRWRPCCGAYAR